MGENERIKYSGFCVDKPGYKKSFLCLLGFHKASRYVFAKEDGVDYFVCKKCGKRYKILS